MPIRYLKLSSLQPMTETFWGAHMCRNKLGFNSQLRSIEMGNTLDFHGLKPTNNDAIFAGLLRLVHQTIGELD